MGNPFRVRPASAKADRRTVLVGAGAIGAAGFLSACGGGGPNGPADASPGTSLTSTGEVPVGGGVILESVGTVVTQPTEGDFKAFSNVCTHQGCQVTEVVDGSIHCPCHGSRFSVADGSVQTGPATESLPEVPIAVRGDHVVRW
jgi:Rieske Fe-S protein